LGGRNNERRKNEVREDERSGEKKRRGAQAGGWKRDRGDGQIENVTKERTGTARWRKKGRMKSEEN
jgi:hypothetical protein